jgi:hypothetical protein
MIAATSAAAPPPRPGLLGRLFELVRESQRRTDEFDQAVADFLSVSCTEARCLDVLHQAGPLTAGQYAEGTRLTTGAITWGRLAGEHGDEVEWTEITWNPATGCDHGTAGRLRRRGEAPGSACQARTWSGQDGPGKGLRAALAVPGSPQQTSGPLYCCVATPV